MCECLCVQLIFSDEVNCQQSSAHQKINTKVSLSFISLCMCVCVCVWLVCECFFFFIFFPPPIVCVCVFRERNNCYIDNYFLIIIILLLPFLLDCDSWLPPPSSPRRRPWRIVVYLFLSFLLSFWLIVHCRGLVLYEVNIIIICINTHIHIHTDTNGSSCVKTKKIMGSECVYVIYIPFPLPQFNGRLCNSSLCVCV